MLHRLGADIGAAAGAQRVGVAPDCGERVTVAVDEQAVRGAAR